MGDKDTSLNTPFLSRFPFWKHTVVLRIQKSTIKSIRMGRVGTKTEDKLKQMNPIALEMKHNPTKGKGAGED